ncbi:hypothetical protein [Streptomyces sp. WAC06614]|uniref:hypothetical protein n=1 Tax=Streptomyces sp. WAC06614 TaxID=2487416 RepID=UPI000F77A7BB|nr:hypothetical protein [Streptomyces sp. WAC06614]RSS56462.1 hypothetical protein EF918_34070 [Streptomyces sp. WAC06614]
MGYILLGHGSYYADRTTAPDAMELVGVPPGTTVHCFDGAEHHHQELVHGGQPGLWEQLGPAVHTFDSSGPAVNRLELRGGADLHDDGLLGDPAFAGHHVVLPGVGPVPDPLLLCDGGPATCPDAPDGTTGNAAEHRCTGILGLFGGHDLYLVWAASFRAAGTPGPHDQRAVAERNGDAVDMAGDGATLSYLLGGPEFLLSPEPGFYGHRGADLARVRGAGDFVQGTLVFHRGDPYGAAGFAVAGLPPDRRGVVEAAIARFCRRPFQVRFI